MSIQRLPLLALTALTLAYAAVMLARLGAVAGGSDNSGYYNEARLLGAGSVHAPVRELPGLEAGKAPAYLYVPLGFRPAPGDPGRLCPTYPPGFPLMLVPAAALLGWEHAGDGVLLVHALAGLVLVYALGRRCGLTGAWALAASAVLAASPLYLFNSLQALSDVPATAWVTLAVLAALLAEENALYGFLCGACLGVAFLVRPNCFLAAVPIACVLGLRWRALAACALAAAPFAAFWMALNAASYGHPLESGYGSIFSEFHASLVGPTLAFCISWLPLLLGPGVVASPFVVLVPGVRGRHAWMLVSWAAAFVAFFAPYRWTHETWWFLRFLLPAAPALLVAGWIALRFVFEKVCGGPASAVRWALPLALAASIAVELSQRGPVRDAWDIGRGESKYGRVAQWVNAHVPPGSAVYSVQASGALFYYTHLSLLRFDQVDAGLANKIDALCRDRSIPQYAVLFPFEMPALKALRGTWREVGRIDDVTVWLRSDS